MRSQSSLKFLNGGFYGAPRGRDFPPHRHTCWELVLYLKGNIEAPVGEEVYLTRPGLMLCTPPGVEHCERAVTAYSNVFITVEPSTGVHWPRCVSDDEAGTLHYLLRAMVHHISKPHDAHSSQMLPLLEAQLGCFLNSHREPKSLARGEELVRAAEEIIRARFADTLEVSHLATELHTAPSALRAHFAAQRGYSPQEALQRERLRQALAYLKSSDLSLERIAQASGYYSASHLSRHVKAATGQSPGRFRREMA